MAVAHNTDHTFNLHLYNLLMLLALLENKLQQSHIQKPLVLVGMIYKDFFVDPIVMFFQILKLS